MKINQLVNECYCSMHRLSFSGIHCVRDHEIKLLARHLLKRNMVLCSQCHMQIIGKHVYIGTS